MRPDCWKMRCCSAFLAAALFASPPTSTCSTSAWPFYSFTGRLRYSGSSLGYQLASVIAGGPAPLIATWLFGTYHSSYAIAVYIAACAVLSLIATALMTDYTGKDIAGEYAT